MTKWKQDNSKKKKSFAEHKFLSADVEIICRIWVRRQIIDFEQIVACSNSLIIMIKLSESKSLGCVQDKQQNFGDSTAERGSQFPNKKDPGTFFHIYS